MQSQTSILLNRANLSSLPNDIRRPAYDVENVQTGIVHIGVGGFHRAHEAMYVDRLMAKNRRSIVGHLWCGSSRERPCNEKSVRRTR